MTKLYLIISWLVYFPVFIGLCFYLLKKIGSGGGVEYVALTLFLLLALILPFGVYEALDRFNQLPLK